MSICKNNHSIYKLRNQIAHGDSDISHKVAQDAIANFRKVLDELGEM